jgi:hypothetical protein
MTLQMAQSITIPGNWIFFDQPQLMPQGTRLVLERPELQNIASHALCDFSTSSFA